MVFLQPKFFITTLSPVIRHPQHATSPLSPPSYYFFPSSISRKDLSMNTQQKYPGGSFAASAQQQKVQRPTPIQQHSPSIPRGNANAGNEGIIVANRAGDEETEDGRIRNREASTKIRDAWIYKQIRARQVSASIMPLLESLRWNRSECAPKKCFPCILMNAIVGRVYPIQTRTHFRRDMERECQRQG